MSVKFVIGGYKVKPMDVVINNWSPHVVKKKKLNPTKGNIVLYAEYLGLNKKDIEYLMKGCTESVIVVCETKRALNGVRKHKDAKVEYAAGYSEPCSAFDLAKLIVACKDRDYVHEFLKYNKSAMYMVVKCLVSNYMYMCMANQRAVAWLDTNLYNVNPEFLWAYAARMMKVEPTIRYMKWHWPKKVAAE